MASVLNCCGDTKGRSRKKQLKHIPEYGSRAEKVVTRKRRMGKLLERMPPKFNVRLF